MNDEMTSDLLGVVQQLKVLDERATARVEEAEASVAAARGEQKRIRSMLAVAEPPARPKQKPKQKKASDEAIAQVRAAIESPTWEPALPDVPGSFTRSQVRDATGLGQSTVSTVIDELHERQVLRQAGSVRLNGVGKAAEVYALDEGVRA